MNELVLGVFINLFNIMRGQAYENNDERAENFPISC